jgi:hypothetical protein
MRAIRAKQIKYSVMAALYGDVTIEQKEAILKDRRFKATYRAAKKNYHRNKAK